MRLTDGTSISTPPGPVTCHLLRSLLSFKMHSSPLRIVFCEKSRGDYFIVVPRTYSNTFQLKQSGQTLLDFKWFSVAEIR